MRIHMYSIHGLFRQDDLELGRDSDNGGQIIYVMALARALSERPEVDHVHLFTRKIEDKDLSPDYGVTVEKVNEKFDIRRIPCGGKRYLPKEQLWPHLDEYVSNAIKHIKSENIFPDWMHSHYADAAYVAAELSAYLNIPFAHSAHSLGRAKLEKLTGAGMDEAEAYETFQFERRFEAEDLALDNAEFVVTSTEQEIQLFEEYKNYNRSEFHVLPPGIDFKRFYPYYDDVLDGDHKAIEEKQALFKARERMHLFLKEPDKPIILAICRPDRRKNIEGLLDTYGMDKELQALANLAIFAGLRKDISAMPEGEKRVLTNILLAMDKYDLYGKLAIPKSHDTEWEVPEVYRLCARQRGVFVNVAFTEQFGLTTLEASACGLPVVVTDHGGPVEIVPKCGNGILVDPRDTAKIQASLKTVLTDAEQWQEFSNTGIRNVRKHYSWETHVDRYLELVTENRRSSEGFGIKNIGTVPRVQQRLKTARRMLITDIDDTLVSEKGQYEGLDEALEVLRNRGGRFVFGIATGRSLDLTRKVIEEFDLPMPDLAIVSVGTYIYYGMEHELRDKGWEQHIGYRWDRDQIAEIASQVPGLELQEEAAQNPFKISFYQNPGIFRVEALEEALGSQVTRVNITPSRDRFVDLLPRRASKGKAVRYLSHTWSIPLREIVVCGDSGNDLDMFTGAARGVVVANHAPEMEELKGKRGVYFASKPCAAGIVEGLRHFDFL